MSKKDDSTTMCFQELWSITVGKSSIDDPNFVGNQLTKKVPCLEKCLEYFKPNSDASKTKLKNDKNISEDLRKFCLTLAEFLNLDATQTHDIVLQYSQYEFHGSKEKFENTLTEERNHLSLLGRVTEFYFNERLYLLRILKHILSHFENKDHKFQQEYAEIVNIVKTNIAKELFCQYEKEFSSDPPSAEKRGGSFTQQVVIPFAMQAMKEQCEMLEILFIYYSHFEMTPDIILKLVQSFKDQGFGAGHPLLEVIDESVLNGALTRLNALQQMIIIEGFDMEYLQRLSEAEGVEEHKMSINKTEFKVLDKIFCSLDVPAMAPLLLAWTTIRYQVLAENGGELTQKLGERVIEQKVWYRIVQIVDMYPKESKSSTALTMRNVLRRLMSCVTHSFHEDTLGDYDELMETVVRVLQSSPASSDLFWSGKKNGTGLHLLLSSATGYFPLHIAPLMRILMSVTSGKQSSFEVFSFISQLPSIAEYLTARGTDDVESVDDGSCWRLLVDKTLILAGGFHHIRIPKGCLGQLQDSPIGAIVQWQITINGWKFFNAEIESILQYRGQSSDLEVLGYIDKATLIYSLVERVLSSVPSYDNGNRRELVLCCLEPFIEKVFPLVQRLVSMVNLPMGLFSLCIQCLTGWLKCDDMIIKNAESSQLLSLQDHKNLLSVMNGMMRVQFLPFSEHNFLESLESAAKLPLHYVSNLQTPLYPGIYGHVLTSVERPMGCYPISVAVLDLILALVERSISWRFEKFLEDDEEHLRVLMSSIAPPVLFFLKEIFPTFDKWRIDPETTDKIGLKCLNLCHVVLRSYHPGSDSSALWSSVQHVILTILTHSHSVDIILKLISFPVNNLHALITAEPSSLAAVHMTDAIRFGFSVLNNVLRLEHEALNNTKPIESTNPGGNNDDTVQSSHLHSILSAPGSAGPNLVSLVAGYLHHRSEPTLPYMAISLLRRISIAVPMSLHASLGKDVAALRDILLSRLRSKAEDAHLKIGILEFLTISVQTQPGLLEHFLDLEAVDKDKPEKGLRLGKYSCLSAVLELIGKEKQGTPSLPAELHASCAKFLSSLWVDRRHSALKALRSYSTSGTGTVRTSFWHPLLLPLFCENPPREVAQSDLLEASAHVLNTLGLENFYTTPSGKDPALEPIMKEFAAKDRFNHWSKVFVCVCKTLPRLNDVETESRLMFITAWRIFVLSSKINNPVMVRKYIQDIVMAINALVANLDAHGGMITALNLASSLSLALLNKAPKDTLTDIAETKKIFSSTIEHIERLETRVNADRSLLHLRALALHYFKLLKTLSKGKIELSPSILNWLRLSCIALKKCCRAAEKDGYDSKKSIEASRLLIQTVQEVFIVCELEQENMTACLKILVEECTLNLLTSVLLQLFSTTNENNEGNALRCSLALSILKLFVNLCRHEEPALALLKTGTMPEFCLKSVNTYTNVVLAQKKKWNSVYQLAIVLVQNMLDSLSHSFLERALDFIGVHNDRIIQCLEAVNYHQTSVILQEATFTTALLSSLSKSFAREWRFKLPHSYQSCMENVLMLCNSCVALLLRPRLLQESIEMTSKKDTNAPIPPVPASQQSVRQASVISRKSLSQDDVEDPSPEFLAVKHGLLAVLGNCLAVCRHLSPDLCQVLLDQGVDPEEFQPLLTVAFSTPSLDQVALPTFGTVISASNVAWKVISQSSTFPELTAIATYVMDIALAIAVSQGMLLLKHPNVSARDKQRLRRELGDELIACLRSANRHTRLSGGVGSSPQSSPSGAKTPLVSRSQLVKQFSSTNSAQRQYSVSIDRGMLDLVDLFVKAVLR